MSSVRTAVLSHAEHTEPIGEGAAGDVGGVGVDLELVRHAGAKMELDGQASVAETLGIVEILVTEDVELTHLEVTGGQTREINGASRCGNSAMFSSLNFSFWCVSTSWSLRRNGVLAGGVHPLV